jgi:hypothetical protein
MFCRINVVRRKKKFPHNAEEVAREGVGDRKEIYGAAV